MLKIYAADPNFLASYLSDREKITASGITDEIMSRLEFDPKTFTFNDRDILSYDPETGDAHISVTGPLSRNGPDLWDLFCGYGGTAYGEIKKAVHAAEKNESAKKIILDMDTPGGEVAGVDEVAQAIADCGKRIEAINHGMIASAGYWLASQAKKIYSTSPVNETGSVGVVIAGYDVSKMLEKAGVREVVIVSKNAPDKYPQLSDKKGIAVLQDRVDATERIFHDRVAKGRRITREQVAETYGRGRVLVAKDPDGDDAISIGMIDGLTKESGSDNISAGGMLAQTDAPASKKSPAVAGTKGGSKMDLDQILTENPAVAAQYRERMRGEYERGKTEATEAAEKRVKAVVPFLKAEAYGDDVKTLAAEVLAGEADPVELKAYVRALDAGKAAKVKAAAVTESDEVADVPAESVSTEAADPVESLKAQMKGGK